jgi:selenophosphate synthetase-related protein
MRIEVVQWREIWDDEDCLNIEVFGDGDSTDVLAMIAEENDLVLDGDADKGDRLILVTNHETIFDGDILTSRTDGRRYRLNLTEVSE